MSPEVATWRCAPAGSEGANGDAAAESIGSTGREEDASDRRIVRNYLTDAGNITVGAVLQIAGTYIVNILKRLDHDQLARLEQSLADLNHAAVDAREQPSGN